MGYIQDGVEFPNEEACKTYYYCVAFGIDVPIEYQIVGFNKKRLNHGFYALETNGRIVDHQDLSSSYKRPILRKIKDSWFIPTDKDAILRPDVQVRESHDQPWQSATLVFVNNHSKSPFVVMFYDGSVLSCKYCQMEKQK